MNEVISTAVNGVEFDPRYSEIEFTLSEFDSQTDPLNAVDNARDINWHAIREQSAALLEQCFDLHVVLWFMRANLHIDGFSAVYQGITTIDGKYAEEGSTIFPQADMEPATDSFHAAALGWLATSSCLHEIKNSKIFPDTPLTTDELLNMRMDEQEGKSLHFSEVVKVLGQADSYFAGRNMPSLKEQLSRGIDAPSAWKTTPTCRLKITGWTAASTRLFSALQPPTALSRTAGVAGGDRRCAGRRGSGGGAGHPARQIYPFPAGCHFAVGPGFGLFPKL